MPSLSKILGVAALLALSFGRGRPTPAAQSTGAVARQDLDDLYSIWKDEIQTNLSGNVYAGLGNRLQLDGESYNYLFRALTAYDRIRATERAPDFAEKQASLGRQLPMARKLFEGVLKNLPWAKYRIVLQDGRVEIEGPDRLRPFEDMPERVLFTVANLTGATRNIEIAASGLAPAVRLVVQPASERHLMGVIERPSVGASPITIVAADAATRMEKKIQVEVRPTGVLEVRLVSSEKPVSARVRVTSGDRYLPPEAHTYGLILKMFGPEQSQIAQRWFYADGVFRARAPSGTVNVSIRKGLEYKSLDLRFEVPAGSTMKKNVELTRWIDMAKKGWRSGDVHLHYFDPPSIRFEMEAEDLAAANILIMNEYGATVAREYFTGAPDPISDAGHMIYYDEEFRHEELGHLALLNLKSLVEPISTGHLGAAHAQIYRGTHFRIEDEPRKPRAGGGSPDRLLVDAMRETHRQGGLVNWAHLRDDLEFPLDAALGQLDAVDIITDTKIDEALTFWYSLLNCGFRLAATAGTDRSEAHIPVGHQRTYAKLPFPFTHAQWFDAIRRGASFVTNGPMIELTVDGRDPGDDIALSKPRRLRIVARAESQIPFETLEVVQNGRVIRSVKASGGRRAELAFDQLAQGSGWIAARSLGPQNPEIMYYPHSEWSQRVVAHTSPVYLKSDGVPLAVPADARFLLDRLRKLELWASEKAYFGDADSKAQALRTIALGEEFYRKMARQ